MPMMTTSEERLPFGTADLWRTPTLASTNPRRVRCYVRGCKKILATPRRGVPGETCPEHGIRCHFSGDQATYSYRNVRENVIASQDLLARRIVGHTFKYESHRLGSEKSEDAVSWNVFRSFQEAGLLHRIANAITGSQESVEPLLYLWGICATGDRFLPWDLLIKSRRRFENILPVKRPLTEPDIALHLPGQYLILIEAKFTSPNTCYERGPRKDRSSLTLDELLRIYHDPRLTLLDLDEARRRPRVYYQLWRNTVFAEWMAQQDHPNTKAFHVNLVRDGREQESAAEFSTLLTAGHEERFQRLTWEKLYSLAGDNIGLSRLRRYLETKTAGLQQAFNIKTI